MLSRPRARTMHGPGSPASWATRHTPPPTCRLTCRQFTGDRLNCQQLKSTSFSLASQLVGRGFLRVAHAGHDVCQPAVRRR